MAVLSCPGCMLLQAICNCSAPTLRCMLPAHMLSPGKTTHISHQHARHALPSHMLPIIKLGIPHFAAGSHMLSTSTLSQQPFLINKPASHPCILGLQVMPRFSSVAELALPSLPLHAPFLLLCRLQDAQIAVNPPAFVDCSHCQVLPVSPAGHRMPSSQPNLTAELFAARHQQQLAARGSMPNLAAMDIGQARRRPHSNLQVCC